MRPYAVYVTLCVIAIISNLILYLKRKVAHRISTNNSGVSHAPESEANSALPSCVATIVIFNREADVD